MKHATKYAVIHQDIIRIGDAPLRSLAGHKSGLFSSVETGMNTCKLCTQNQIGQDKPTPTFGSPAALSTVTPPLSSAT